jgi:ketopantoate reductase
MKLATILVENQTIKQIQKKKAIVNHIIDQVKGCDIHKMKTDPDFVMYICEIIENQVSMHKKKASLDKMEIFVDAMRQFKLDDSEINECKPIVEFLCKRKMIKKTPLSRIVYHMLRTFFLRQTLLA